jgi:hypothetical protein
MDLTLALAGATTAVEVVGHAKSGLDQAKPTGSASFGFGSFKSPTGDVNIGAGSHKVGNFLSLSGLRTDRFLDPELEALHDTGNQVSFSTGLISVLALPTRSI